MKKFFFLSLLFLFVSSTSYAKLTADQCQGSLGPYPQVAMQESAPDSLKAVALIHVGRHGSRFPAGSYSAFSMLKALNKADSLHTITPLGQQFKRVVENIIARSIGRWGELDSIGMREQRGIAKRTLQRFPTLLENNISAVSSYSPRAIMSMYSFTHELSKKIKKISLSTHSGPMFNSIVRPFDVDEEYKAYMKTKPYMPSYNSYVSQVAPNTVSRLLGNNYPATTEELKQLSIIEYYNIANMKAMGMENDYAPYMSLDEYEALWSCFNLRQYFMHCKNVYSDAPANIAKPIIKEIISSINEITSNSSHNPVKLMFSHQETVMPLMSLLNVPGCTYKGNDWKNLKNEVQDFNLSPMAANLQFSLYKSSTGRFYLRVDMNEHIISLLPNMPSTYYTPLSSALSYLNSLVK